MKLKRFIVPLLASLALIGGIATSLFIAQPVSATGYPILPSGVAYYKTTYPVGLTYSQGWYGTMTKAPAGTVIYLYDDTNGICLFSEPIGAQSVPSGAQAGTVITPESITAAQTIINSYPTSAYTAVTPAIESTMTALDYYQGVWEGAKLAQKWDTPQATTETILTPAQVTTHNNQQTNIVATFDPPRYFVLPTGNSNWSSTGTWDSLTSVYSTGTATFTNASTDVTGSGTTWTSGMNGDYIVSTTNTLYKISTVNSTTDLTLTGNYVQPTLSGVAYIIGTLATTASVPTSADSVYPGTIGTGATLTVDAGASCLDMDWTGATNTPTLAMSNNLTLFGNKTTISNMVMTGTSTLLINGNNDHVITTGGLIWTCAVEYNTTATNAVVVHLADNLNLGTSQFYMYNGGELDTNNHNITCGTFILSRTNTKTLNLGSSVINCTSWNYGGSNLVITTDGSLQTINCSGNFTGGGITTYNIVNLTGATSTISGSNTFAQLNLTPTVTQTIKFTDGTTQTVTASNLSGSAGHVHTLTGTSTGGWSLAKTGGGTVFADYVNITYSTVPANTFYYGANSTYNSTSGWTEAVLPTITLSAASSIATTTAQLNGNITNLNGSGVGSTVSMYYGTSDGLQVPANWTNTVVPTSPSQPQGVAAFYYSATGLTAGTTYYFSASATNPAGTVWVTASLNFPTICNAPTGVSATDGTYTNKVTVTWTKSTGATGYKVLRGAVNDSGTLGDVATYDDTAAGAPTITAGTATASDGTSTSYVTLTLSGQSGADGSTETYTVYAYNSSGFSTASSGDTGYRGASALSYQWQRSDADSDSNYNTNLGTTNPYNDSTAPTPSIIVGTATASSGTNTSQVVLSITGQSSNIGNKRYYRCVVSMSGATNQNSSADEGYIGVGSLTYQWYRSSGNSDSGYSVLVSATTVPYNDTTAPSPSITAGTASATNGTSTSYVTIVDAGASANVGDTRYYYCVESASGASNQNTNHVNGYIGIGTLTYQWYSSTSSGGSYSAIGGATTSTYNDSTAAPAPTITVGTASASAGTSTSQVQLSVAGYSANVGATTYYECYLDATGASQQITNETSGYIGVGSLTFQWYRSSGTGDNTFSVLVGATTVSFNDTTAPSPFITAGTTTATGNISLTIVTISVSGESTNAGESRYYYCHETATGATNQDTNHSSGYIGVGVLTYQGQRSAADSDASYSNLLGATTSPFDDTNPAPLGQKRFYRYQLSAAGATTVYSTASEGWIFYLGAPTGFTATGSGNNINLSWTPNGNATATVIVMGSGNYPTSITDGTIIYNGASNTYTYANGNSELSTQYLSAFSYASGFGGIYSTDYAKTTGGATMLALFGLIALGAIGSIFAIYKRNLLFALGASVIWFLLIAYTRSTPLPNVTAGSGTDSLWIGACIAFSVATMITTFTMRNNDTKEKEEKNRNSRDYKSEQDVNRYNSRGSSYESADDYQARLARMSRKKKD